MAFSEDELPPAPCGLGTRRVWGQVSPSDTCSVTCAEWPASSHGLPPGKGSTHDFGDEEHIWEGGQHGQAAGQSAAGSRGGHRKPLVLASLLLSAECSLLTSPSLSSSFPALPALLSSSFLPFLPWILSSLLPADR